MVDIIKSFFSKEYIFHSYNDLNIVIELYNQSNSSIEFEDLLDDNGIEFEYETNF